MTAFFAPEVPETHADEREHRRLLAIRCNGAAMLAPFPGAGLFGTSAPQTLTDAGAVNLTSSTTHIVTTGAAALTLADGVEGQCKFLVMKTDGGDATLTPTSLGNGTTVTFNDVGDSAFLYFTNDAWHFMGGTATLA